MGNKQEMERLAVQIARADAGDHEARGFYGPQVCRYLRWLRMKANVSQTQVGSGTDTLTVDIVRCIERGTYTPLDCLVEYARFLWPFVAKDEQFATISDIVTLHAVLRTGYLVVSVKQAPPVVQPARKLTILGHIMKHATVQTVSATKNHVRITLAGHIIYDGETHVGLGGMWSERQIELGMLIRDYRTRSRLLAIDIESVDATTLANIELGLCEPPANLHFERAAEALVRLNGGKPIYHVRGTADYDRLGVIIDRLREELYRRAAGLDANQ